MAEMDTRIKALEKLVNNMEVKTESTEELIEDNEMSSTIGIGLGAAGIVRSIVAFLLKQSRSIVQLE